MTSLKLPSRDNSPINAKPFNFSSLRTSSSMSKPIAIGRSKFEPSFFRSAGARLITTFFAGKVNPEFLIAERTLSLASLIAASGNPTIEKAGKPPNTSVSTVTLYASSPITVAVVTLFTITAL